MNPYRYTPEQYEQPTPEPAIPTEPAVMAPPAPQPAPTGSRRRRRGATAAVALALLAGAVSGGIAGATATRLSMQAPVASSIVAGSNEQRNAPAPGAEAPAPPSGPSGASSTVAGAVFNKVNKSVVQIANGQGTG